MEISEKYMLTVKEADAYFNLGVKKMRRLAEDHTDSFAIYSGYRYLIIRTKIRGISAGKFYGMKSVHLAKSSCYSARTERISQYPR